uniref:Uncharacterized protein n=1 Tax=Alexandrium monilatum TaxID=311494 RepID=A0A7S4ULV0_9DINO
MSGGPECTMDGHGPGGTERSPAMDAAIHELVFVVGASASAEEGVAVAAGRAASEPTSEDGSWEVPVEAAAETPSARSSGPAGGDVSREAEERPSSGPSSIAPSGGLEVDAPPKADLPPELVLEALDCSDEMLWGEADFDEVAGITLADVYSLREARGGTGARDLTRRAQQERRRARDVGQASPKLKPGRVLARHSERVAKAQRAARDRTDYMYRVEERRFKRRYRDWCCFGEAPRESRTRAQAPAAELVPIAEAAALPVARSTMESYARMAYWRTVDLLQRSFGREHPVDASGRRQAAEVLYRRLLKSRPRRRRRGKRSACQEQTGPRDGSDAESPKTTGVEPTSPCACEDPASEAPKDVAEVEGPGGADDLRDLISVWPSLDRFRRADAPRTDGKLLVPALRSSKPPTVATEEVFLERFHGRTRGIFRDLDWSNLRVIGGMMLACLVADDEDFRTSFAETDVDIYMVGLRGPEFQQRVASVMKDLYRAARSRDLKAVILRTPCTITLSLCGPRGEALPNVQVVMAPFESTRHLLSTTDIDCTGFGFDGDSLFATSLACEAIARRRLIARPEKYSIRGEFSTESRLLKYAMRGFDVVDLGLPPDLEVPEHEAIRSIASEASAALAAKALGEGEGGLSLDDTAMRFERALRATGVTGAHLLLLAARNPGLQELLLFDVPLLPAGLADEGLLGMLQACDASRRQDGYEHPRGKAKGRLPRGSQPSKLRVLFTSRTLGPIEEAVLDAVEERDPDGTSEARSWYTGLEAEHLIWEAAC